MKHVAMLLRTGKFSDLKLVCQGTEFFVHTAIVSAGSPVWEAATQGNFKEAQSRVVEVDVVDAVTLQRGLTYLYTGKYDDGEVTPIDYLTAQTGSPQRKTNDEASAMKDDSTGSFDIPAEETQTTASEPANASIPPIGSQQDLEYEAGSPAVKPVEGHRCECLDVRLRKPPAVCNNTKLRTNTLVYIFADYYQISDLKLLAVKKFKVAAHRPYRLCMRGFDKVCHEVYQSAPPTATELRLGLSNIVAKYASNIVEDDSFMSTALLLPALLSDAFSGMIRRLQEASEDRDNIIAELIDAKAQVEKSEEKRHRMANEVNEARQCRHCSLENNVIFEDESPHLNRLDYSFRCKCRTRY